MLKQNFKALESLMDGNKRDDLQIGNRVLKLQLKTVSYLFKGVILVKKTQITGALFVGLLSVVAQIALFYVRFGKWNAYSTVLDYILFFGAGTLGGLILIYFLNRQNSKTARFVILLAFLLASPIALFMMAGGGLLGSIGVLIYPQIPWALSAWLGGLLGNFLAKK
jgi:hypothetical protein